MRHELSFTPTAWEEYVFWQTSDKKMLAKINSLIKEIQRAPFSGIGKPEALKGDFSGFWSRRINEEHRLVYTIQTEKITIVQCRYHYT